jgi:opacity protein-like surface antigen
MKKLVLAVSLLASANVFATEGGYGGLSIGQTDYDTDGFDNATSFAIVAGYRFSENVAIEGQYLLAGESDDDEPPVWTIDGKALGVTIVGFVPVNDNTEFFGKVGIASMDVSLDEDGRGEIASDDETDLTYGVGVKFSNSDSGAFVAEYQIFDFDGDKVNNISVGYRFNF